MLLHSGSGMHGHEFSPSNSTPRRLPLVRSPFATSTSRSSPSYESTPSNLKPIRRLSNLPRKNSDRVSFQEPELDTMAEDSMSYASEGSEVTVGGTRKKRTSSRTSTVYLLAHPAPTLTSEQKLLRIRPRLIFQLQRISNKRPTPAIDVMPSIVVVPRIMKKFPRMFRGKKTLGMNDVIIVKSEDYDTPDESGEEEGDDTVGEREVLAVICQTRNCPSDTEICLADGSIWYGTVQGKNFEFESTDMDTGEVTKARWVQRIRPKRQSSSGQQPAKQDSMDDRKFIFSIVNANTRRHPILASLTKATLDIPDTYITCSSSAGRHPPTSPVRDGYPTPHDEDEIPVQRTSHLLDENTKILIRMTAIWVALKMGWSAYFNYNDSSPPKACTSSGQKGQSATSEQARPSPIDTRSSTPELGNSFTKSSKMTRTGTGIFSRSPSALSSPTFQTAPPPKRSVSAGMAFMDRVAARKNAGSAPSTVASDSEGERSLSPPTRPSLANDLTRSGGSRNKRMSTPSPLALLGSEAGYIDTPTKPHRRIQSAYFANSPLKTQAMPTVEHAREHVDRQPSNLGPLDGTVSITTDGAFLGPGSPVGLEEKKERRWRHFFATIFRRHKTDAQIA